MSVAVLAIIVVSILALTYAITWYLYGTSQVVLPWVIAAGLIALVCMFYIASTANKAVGGREELMRELEEVQ